MGRITFTADEHHEAIIDEGEAEDGVESRSGAVRECITRYADIQQRVEGLQHEIEDQNEKRLILQEREEKQELANYVEQEHRVEQQWRQAGIVTRTKWRLFGMSSSDAAAE